MSQRRLRRRDARLAPVAAAAWIAAWVATRHPSSAGGAATALWIGAVLLLGAAALPPRVVPAFARRALPLAAVTLAFMAAVCTHVAAAEPARTAAANLPFGGGRALTAEVTAVGKIERGGDGWRFDAILDAVSFGDDRFAPSVPVLVRAAEVPVGLDLGARARLTATAWAPGGGGDRAVLILDATAEPVLLSPPPGVLGAAAALRDGLATLTADLPPPGGGLVAGLSVGDTRAVGDELDAAMKASSLSHLTAVSGANCALVVGIAFGLAALCGARRGMRVAVGLAALVGFVVLVSPEPSVVRAAAMATIAMLGLLLGRTGAGLSLLTASVATLLVADPWLAGSIGFALSVAATGALLVCAGPLADGLSRWMPASLALAVSVPLAAQLACAPLIVLITPQVSTYGVVANLLAAPAAPVGTVLGLAACLFAGIPLVGGGLAALAWVPAAWIAETATTFAALPGSSLPWLGGVAGVVTLGIVAAAMAALLVRSAPWVRGAATLVVAASFGGVLALGPIAAVIERNDTPTAWAIAACDVGQGDALLVRSAGAVALIDTGPEPEALERCLTRLGVDHLDLLVLTHFDIDHRGGVPAVVGRVDAVLHGPVDTDEHQDVLDGLAGAGARLVDAARGLSGVLGDARWRVLWPRAHTPPGNDASVTMEFTGGGVPTSLFLGDLSGAGQQAMAAGAVLLTRYDVVKVAHHGSADQYPGLYARVAPAIALVSVGENTYGHPRAETLTMLATIGARTFRTDLDGLSLVWLADGALQVWRATAAAPDVAPAG
ncbi:ComEC/Rec2 family competence protein [Microbacterium sp.]|uniref:ComEC/Rec2 family competence protein n=1 Tax=Microbacterium sp. TaxID=51671 RepID=UPI0039E517BE